jgi:pyruvate/2-oxoglutarate dehydrogenase complex dihydrolipoamide acyltransferase (E2) component
MELVEDVMGNVIARKKQHVSAFRKLAIGTWETTYDPSIHGTMRLRADKLLEYIDKFRAKTGRKLTVTHVVTKAMALALRDCPDANAILRFNRIYLRENVDLSVLVMMEDDGQLDLSASKLCDVDKKSLVQIIDELEAHVAKIRAKRDQTLERTRQSMKLVPAIFMNTFLKLLSFFVYALNLDLRSLGLPKDAFGGGIITSIGPLGLDVGYPPIVPYSRVPIYVAPGEVHQEPVVEDGKVVPGWIINVNATFDHRIVDGSHCAILAKSFRKIMENPFERLDPVT